MAAGASSQRPVDVEKPLHRISRDGSAIGAVGPGNAMPAASADIERDRRKRVSNRKITMNNRWLFFAYGFLAVTGLEAWRPALLLAAAVAGTAMLRSLRRRPATAS